MTSEELRKERRDRFMTAVRLEKPDRQPIHFHMANVPVLKYMDPTKTVADFIQNPYECLDIIADGFRKLSVVDSFMISAPPNRNSGRGFFATTKLPGIDMGPDETWQHEELEPMTKEDYDTVLNNGWMSFVPELERRIGIDPAEDERMAPINAYASQKNQEVGSFFAMDGFARNTFDELSAARGLVNFYRDFRKMPETMKTVIDICLKDSLDDLKVQLEKLKGREEPFWILVSPTVRAANCDFVSRKFFEEYAWPFFREQVNMIIEYGGYVNLHMDCNHTAFLDFFTEFPKGRIMFDTDGSTDFQELYRVLGDRMAITGDVSSTMLSLASPDEVYSYVMKQKELVGNGYIINGACTLPVNTNPRNLDAMIKAALSD